MEVYLYACEECQTVKMSTIDQGNSWLSQCAGCFAKLGSTFHNKVVFNVYGNDNRRLTGCFSMED